MGCCYSRQKCDLVSLHELRNGDHIFINKCCNNVNAIVINIEKNLCVYLDTYSKFVTETHLSTLCKANSKVYRYDYSSITQMSEGETIANSTFFAQRGKFSNCCWTSSYQFAYNCKVNKYTSISLSTSQLKRSTNADTVTNDSTAKEVGISRDQDSLLSRTRNPSLLTMSAAQIDHTLTHTLSKMSSSRKPSLEIQMDRIIRMCDCQNLLMEKIQSLDDQIKNMQNNMSQDCANNVEQNVNESSQAVADAKKEGSLSPIAMDTSMTYQTPIQSHHDTGNAGSIPSVNNHLGVLVVTDLNGSTPISGSQFSIVGSSMSMSPINNETKIK